MADSIEFFDLPALVQSKVVRDHVPLLQKAFVLSKMPEFADNFFKSKHSWTNPSETFFRFFDSVRSLKPGGIYLSKHSWWTHGFSVSVADDVLSFELCCIDAAILDIMSSTDVKTLSFRKPLEDAAEFLARFLNDYVLWNPETVGFYRFDLHGYFFVDYSENALHWVDGRNYSLDENGTCSISDFHADHFKFVLKEDRAVHLHCQNAWSYMYCPCEKIRAETKPLDSESFLAHEEEKNRIYRHRNAFKLDLSVIGDVRVSINAEIADRDTFNIYLRSEIFKSFPEITEITK